MTSFIPITLQGTNMGERHRFLNTLVSDAYKNESLETVLSTTESGAIDRLFKIDLACKHKHVEYILQNLRDDDMLYVSRALKAKWLLDDAYRHIMNPHHLEDVLYPHMITTAVNKIKHWIHLNLRDPIRCLEFYEYYCEKDTKIAIKFLLKCSVQIIEQECTKWFDLMAPEDFKVLCERSPLVAKMFFECLKENKVLREKYFKHKGKYINGLKCVLRADVSIFLDIVERIKWNFPHLSPRATKFIMKEGKERFLQKSELYAVNILHMKTLAQCLSPEECEELVLKLARAKFLEEKFRGWFTYKNVEPLVKRLDATKRDTLRKRVFVTKDVGEQAKEWPYSISDDESLSGSDDDDMTDVFEDNIRPCGLSAKCMSRRIMCCSRQMACPKSLLDILFDKYRFMGFDETLTDIQKKMAAESLPKNRMFMFLVLVSKTGGNMESLQKLVNLMMEHRNEPAHVRAAVVRSLVKRSSVWRVTDDIWESLLVFTDGLGLDGTSSDCECVEGLHAVVIRSFLSNNEIDPAIKTAFRKNFSTLTTYSLTSVEKDILFNSLVKLLLECAKTSSEIYEQSCILMYLLDTIRDYKRYVDQKLIQTIKAFAAKDKQRYAAVTILRRLFKSRIGRKELFNLNFDLFSTADSYMNALKHDTHVLSAEDFVKLVTSEGLNAGYFLRKINIYFAEKEGVKDSFLEAIKKAKPDKNKTKLARALVYLIGDGLKSFIIQLDAEGSKENKLYSAQVRGHAHVARPVLSVDSTEWPQYGAKHIANRVLVCRQEDIDHIIKQLLLWKRTAKLALILSKRTNYVSNTLAAVADLRPTAALKSGLANILQKGENYDPQVWEIVKPLMMNINEKSIDNSHYLRRHYKDKHSIPLKIKPEYVALAFTILKKFDENVAVLMLYEVNLLLSKIDEGLIQNVLLDYLSNEFFLEKMPNRKNCYDYKTKAFLHLRILGKYLLLCKTEESQTRRFENVGVLYLNRLESFWKSNGNEKVFVEYVDNLLKSLKYTEVFLNEEYADCLPVMGKVARWMQSILPMEEYFNLFVDLHLTMSYCRAIRQSVKQAPEVFSDKKTRLKEGVKIVGKIFGKYISHEAHDLRMKYFDSIVELYSTHMENYLSAYFNYGARKLKPYIIRSLLTSAHDVECYLAVTLFKYYKYFGVVKEINEIREIMKQRNDKESQFFFHCVLSEWYIHQYSL